MYIAHHTVTLIPSYVIFSCLITDRFERLNAQWGHDHIILLSVFFNF